MLGYENVTAYLLKYHWSLRHLIEEEKRLNVYTLVIYL